MFLDSLVTFLEANSNVSIGIFIKETAHITKSEHYGLCRAKSIKKYLVKHGISEDRLEANGVTETTDKKLSEIIEMNFLRLKEFEIIRIKK